MGWPQPKDTIRSLQPFEDTEMPLHCTYACVYEVHVCEKASPPSFSRNISKSD